MQESFLESNLSYIPDEISQKIRNSNTVGEIYASKSGAPILKINDIFFHSNHDPHKESRRLIDGLKLGNENKLYIFFGAGLGYSILTSLEYPNITVVWMECDPGIFKLAFQCFDFSRYLDQGRLRILLSPFLEDTLFTAFKGLGALPTSFIPHRPSLSWKTDEYMDCKYICEKFFRKKDVNIATLSKFETIWTRNLIQNIPELLDMNPVSQLFNIAIDIPILVCGAGPSLYNDIDKIIKYRNLFILICVDTALNILSNFGIEPDLIYSVDPQSINKSYLEGYSGDGIIVFDPTSCYHTLRLPGKFSNGFFTSSPFPLIQILSKHTEIDIGDIPFGGSVSTNAISLAEMMGAKNVLFVGQDLAFTDGFAHCKGAVLEERLNVKESRKFRREYHNFKQLFALPKIEIQGMNGNAVHTNEKMQIFRKWFSDRGSQKNWLNLTSGGGKINNIPISSFDIYFKENIINPELVKSIQLKIKSFVSIKKSFFDKDKYITATREIIHDLDSYEIILKQGIDLSERIYTLILKRKESTNEFHTMLKEIEKVDEKVSSKRGLSEIIGLGVQRIILMITEGYETNLSVEEKKNSSLSIAKKSILLYRGLYDSTNLIRKSLKKSIYRISNEYKL